MHLCIYVSGNVISDIQIKEELNFLALSQCDLSLGKYQSIYLSVYQSN
jgi:hypothetical protein